MIPRCPVCDEPMKQHGRAFRCEPCREIIIFFDVSDASPYIAATNKLNVMQNQQGSRQGNDRRASCNVEQPSVRSARRFSPVHGLSPSQVRKKANQTPPRISTARHVLTTNSTDGPGSAWRASVGVSIIKPCFLILGWELALKFSALGQPYRTPAFSRHHRVSAGRRIFGGVPQRLGRGVEPINGFVCCTAGIVRSRWNLFACFGCAWFAILLWHCLCLP
jgi:hypothetical protein